MASDDLDHYIRQLDAYRTVVQSYHWPAYTGPVEDFYDQKQDQQPALKAKSGKVGLRFVEEVTVYDHDGTMLGYMTLSTAIVEPRWGALAWLTPAYIHTTITNADAINRKKNPLS